jgi:ribosomal protein S18 acetylase RimI-like enzyme
VIEIREISENETALAWGHHHLYVDDVSTLPAARRRGCGELLMDWLAEEAARFDCEGLHLDSGVSADRAPAHRLYIRHQLGISVHHFKRSDLAAVPSP